MPQPTPYNRLFSFTDWAAGHPTDPMPGYRVDAEFDGINTTLQGVLGNLRLIQRDDGKLADGCITLDSLDTSLFLAIAAAAPPGPKGDKGDKGDSVVGANAPNPNFTFTAHALAPGAVATIAATGIYPNLAIDIGVPKGDPALPGAATLVDATYGDVLVSGNGTVFTVNKVNGQLPSFPGHVHIIANITGLQAALDAKQAAGSYAAAAHAHTIADLTAWGLLSREGDDFGELAFINSSGVMEVGQYIDFHAADNEGAVDYRTRLNAVANGAGWAFSMACNALFVGGTLVSLVGHTHPISDVTGLQGALDGKQPAGSYATTAQLSSKADALTTVHDFTADQAVSDAAHNGCYNRITGATARTVTFGNPTQGHASVWVNRGTVGMTIICGGGYYKNGAAASATANLTLAPGGKLTAFHEGAGVWTFEGTGF